MDKYAKENSSQYIFKLSSIVDNFGILLDDSEKLIFAVRKKFSSNSPGNGDYRLKSINKDGTNEVTIGEYVPRLFNGSKYFVVNEFYDKDKISFISSDGQYKQELPLEM